MPETRTVTDVDRDLAAATAECARARDRRDVDAVLTISTAINLLLAERFALMEAER